MPTMLPAAPVSPMPSLIQGSADLAMLPKFDSHEEVGVVLGTPDVTSMVLKAGL